MTPNFVNRTIWTGDNLDVMRGMNSDSVDLIYLDPPFNSHVDNLQLLCGACNSAKRTGTQDALIARLVDTGVRV